jgi:hypothetical protein
MLDSHDLASFLILKRPGKDIFRCLHRPWLRHLVDAPLRSCHLARLARALGVGDYFNRELPGRNRVKCWEFIKPPSHFLYTHHIGETRLKLTFFSE